MAWKRPKKSQLAAIIFAVFGAISWIANQTDAAKSLYEKWSQLGGVMSALAEILNARWLAPALFIACLLAFAWELLPTKLKRDIKNHMDIVLVALFGAVVFAGGFTIYKQFIRGIPDLWLLEPSHKYSFTWDSRHNLQWVTRPILAENEPAPHNTRLPVLRLRNHGTASAKYLSIEWVVLGKPITEVFVQSAMAKVYSVVGRNGGLLGLRSNTVSGAREFQTACADSNPKQPLQDFLAPFTGTGEIDVPIPNEIWGSIEIRILAARPPNQEQGTINGAPVKVSVTYQDGFKGTHTERFVIHPSLHFVPPPPQDPSEFSVSVSQLPPPLYGSFSFQVSEDCEKMPGIL
jgi:hypothetical protein